MNKIIVTIFLIFSFSSFASLRNVQDDNKELVKNFYNTAFNMHKPEKAVKNFIGKTYRQHNPYAADGSKPFVKFFKKYYQEHPQAKVEIKRLISEGDMVVVHAHSKRDPFDRGFAVVDIFRLYNGKIVEHWDVMQKVPEKPANKNTMF